MSDEDYKETWFIVPRSIIDIPSISLGFLKVFETIFQFWNKGRKCYLSNPEIARRTGLKVTQVKDGIAFFERHGELERLQIGMKRYLIQPIKSIEIPGLEIVPKGVAAPAATCASVNQVAAPAARGGRSSGYLVAAPAATEIKKLNKEKKRSNTKESYSLEEALKENPHNLSLEILEEWNSIRIRKHKSPLTPRAWTRTNNVLTLLISKGLRLNDIIDRMLAAEWRGIEVSYFEKEIAAASKTPVIRSVADPIERERLKQEAIAREQKEEEAKQRERKEAPQSMRNLKLNGGFKAAEEMAERERKELGMTKMEYSAYVLNKRTVSTDDIQGRG